MLFRHTLIYAFAKGIPGIITFVSIIIFTRMLTPEQYGKYALVVVIVYMINAIMFQWLRLGIIRFLPSDNNQKTIFKGTVILGFLFLMIISFVILLLTILFFQEALFLMVMSLVYLWLLAWFEMTQTVFRSELQPVRFGLLSFIKALLSVVLGVVFIYFSFEEKGPVLGLIAGTVIALLFSSFNVWKLSDVKKADPGELKKLLWYGLPLTVTFAMAVLIQGTDRVFLSWFGGAEDTGLYAVAADFSQQTLLNIMMIVNMGAFPIVVKKMESFGVEEAVDQLKQNFKLLMTLSVPAVIGIILLIDNISGLFFGAEFRDSAKQIIPIIIFGSFCLGLKSYYFDLAFQLGNKTKWQLIPVAIAAVLNIVLNFLFIPAWGAIGAAYVSVIAYVVALLSSWYFATKCFPIRVPLKEVWPIIVAGAGMCLALLPVMNYQGVLMLIFQVLYGLIIYLLTLFIFNYEGYRDSLFSLMKQSKVKRKKGI